MTGKTSLPAPTSPATGPSSPTKKRTQEAASIVDNPRDSKKQRVIPIAIPTNADPMPSTASSITTGSANTSLSSLSNARTSSATTTKKKRMPLPKSRAEGKAWRYAREVLLAQQTSLSHPGSLAHAARLVQETLLQDSEGPGSGDPECRGLDVLSYAAIQRLRYIAQEALAIIAASEKAPKEDGQLLTISPSTAALPDTLKEDEQLLTSNPTTVPAGTHKTPHVKTTKSHSKAEEIHRDGHPAPVPCSQCSKSHRACFVLPRLSPSCGHCVAVKQKCGFAMAADGRAIRAEGVPALEPCMQCIEKGIPQECFQPNATQFAKLGTACSGCQVDGKRQECSINLAPRMRDNKPRKE